MNHENHDHGDIGCMEAIEGLYAWLDGELGDPAEIAAIEAHVKHCKSCWSRAEVERLLTRRIHDVLTDEPADATAEAPERLRSRLRELMNKF